MDQSSQVPHADILSAQPNVVSTHLEDKEQSDGSNGNINMETLSKNLETSNSHGNDEVPFRIDDRSGRVHPTVDIAEVIRRWTHALQRIHKQSLLLVCCLSTFHLIPALMKRF